MDLGLKDKRVLVLGASSGIGYAVAESFVKEGAKVAVASRSEARIQAAKSNLGAEVALTVDLSLKGSGKTIVEQAIEKLGGIDVVVLNSGGPPKGNFQEISNEVWEEQFQNLWMSTVESLQVALPKMREQKFGRILIITSVAAKEAMPALTVSNGFRAGLMGLVRSVANEVACDGVTLNTILPGFTNTERLQALNLTEEVIKAKVPAGRLGKPEEIGDLACFLASAKAAYINAQHIAVDGGYLAGI